MVLAMPISATAAFLVLMKWKTWLPAAAVGGPTYGFSPYMIGQALGILSPVLCPAPPNNYPVIDVDLPRSRDGLGGVGLQLGLLLHRAVLDFARDLHVTLPSSPQLDWSFIASLISAGRA